MSDWTTLVLGDATLLYGFQAVVIAFAIFAELRDRGWFTKPTGLHAEVTRGETSWNMLNFSFGIVAVNVLQIINIADDSAKFKVFMSGFDLIIMIRLFFFNGWFRNKVIGLIVKSMSLREGQKAIPKPSAPPASTNDV